MNIVFCLLTGVFISSSFICNDLNYTDNLNCENDDTLVNIDKYTIVENDNVVFSNVVRQLKDDAPNGYDCGYVITDTYGTPICGVFLIKNKWKYYVIYKKADKTETYQIKPKIARKLISSLKSNIDQAVKPNIDGDAKDKEHPDVIVIVNYDGNYVYAITPDEAALYKIHGSENIPDDIWREEILKLIFVK